MSDELVKSSSEISVDAIKEKVKLNKALRNFFFYSLKGNVHFKEAKEEIGEITSVAIIITPLKTFMRAIGKDDKMDIAFTNDEKKTMLKTFKVKQETVDACKSIFLLMDMEKKTMHIKQNKLDGTQKEIDI